MCEMEATPTDTVYIGVYVKLENLFQPPLLLLTTPITVCFFHISALIWRYKAFWIVLLNTLVLKITDDINSSSFRQVLCTFPCTGPLI